MRMNISLAARPATQPWAGAGAAPFVSWPILVWAFTLLMLAKGGTFLSDPDTFWHIEAGRWIIQHGQVPVVDPFSHSMPGAAWTAHEWLAEIIFAKVHEIAGWNGLVVLIAVLVSATLAGMTRFLLRYLQPVHALIFVALATGMLRSHLLARPHILVVPIVALWLAALVSARDREAGPPWQVIPLMVLWANLHGSFTFGLALAGAMALEAMLAGGRAAWFHEAKRWCLFVGLATLAAMVTPSHIEGLLFTLHVASLGSVLAHIGEWRSPDFQQFYVFEVWLLLLLLTALSGRLKIPLIRAVIIIGMVHLSLKHSRYMAVTGLVMPFLLAAPFARHWYASKKLGDDQGAVDRIFEALAPPANRIGAVVVGALSVAALAAVLALGKFLPPPTYSPEAALQSLRESGVSGPLFNSYGFGGYLIFHRVPVFIDGRADMYGEAFVDRYAEAIQVKAAEGLTSLLDEYRIEATMLTAESPAAVLLDHLAGWRRIHADDVAVVHVRGPSNAGR